MGEEEEDDGYGEKLERSGVRRWFYAARGYRKQKVPWDSLEVIDRS